MAIKVRTGHILLEQRASIIATFHKMIGDNLTVLSVNRMQFLAAARFVDLHTLGLRAGDALHLAVASHHGATVCTLDRRLAEAGPILGVPTLLI